MQISKNFYILSSFDKFSLRVAAVFLKYIMFQHPFLQFFVFLFLFLIFLPFTSIFQCICKKNSKNAKSRQPPPPTAATANEEAKKNENNELIGSKDTKGSSGGGSKQQQQQQPEKVKEKSKSKEQNVQQPIQGPKEPESEKIIPIMCIRAPNDAAEHVKTFYESGEAQLIMEAELVAYEEMDKVVRLELFARVIHYIDSKLQGQGVDFNTVPPTVPEAAKNWAISRGMPPILRARTEMLIEYEKFMCPKIPDDLHHLPPDGTLNTVYKHAMREDLPFLERMELLDEIFVRTCKNVSQKWHLILTQKVPYPALGRVYRRNPKVFEEYNKTLFNALNKILIK